MTIFHLVIAQASNDYGLIQFWVPMGSIVIALIALGVSVMAYLSNVEPKIIVYLSMDEDSMEIIVINVENIGSGVAENITLDLPDNIPWRAFGITGNVTKQPQALESGPLRKGIKMLEPGGKRRFMWGQYGGLIEALGDESPSVEIKYDYPCRIKPYRITRDARFILEVKSFENVPSGANDPMLKTARALEEISQVLQNSSTDFSPLHVALARTSDERRNELLEKANEYFHDSEEK